MLTQPKHQSTLSVGVQHQQPKPRWWTRLRTKMRGKRGSAEPTSTCKTAEELEEELRKLVEKRRKSAAGRRHRKKRLGWQRLMVKADEYRKLIAARKQLETNELEEEREALEQPSSHPHEDSAHVHEGTAGSVCSFKAKAPMTQDDDIEGVCFNVNKVMLKPIPENALLRVPDHARSKISK